MSSPEELRYLAWFLANVDIYSNDLGNAILYQLGRVPLYERLPLPQWAAVMELQHPIRPEDVKTAYRRLAKKYHPDAGGTDEQMKQLNAARTQALAHFPI
ncbi:DnaJ domain-containing protein [Hymenobacter lapidarius]|nr:DnaJ domain-containing protein [Hymenobacter lapidarius]